MSLSDTMFGVAMTLLATTLLPPLEQLKGSAFEMMRALGEPLAAVALSFAVSAIYWLSQQRRLAMTAVLTPAETILHLVFLFLIVLLPISTELISHSGATAAPAAIFGFHLTLIAAANLALWVGVHRRVEVWSAVLPAALALIWLGGAFVVGLFQPRVAQYLWYFAFANVPLSRLVHRAWRRTRGHRNNAAPRR